MISNDIVMELCREHFGDYENFALEEGEIRIGEALHLSVFLSFSGHYLDGDDISKLLSIKKATRRLFMLVEYNAETEKFLIKYEDVRDGNE